MRTFVMGCLLMLGVLSAAPAEAIERQRAMNWCWAAAVQDVLAPVNVHTSQEQIVHRLTGWLPDRPASTYEVQNLVRSYGIRANVVQRPGNVFELVRPLSSGYKIIALAYPNGGAVGHFIVLERVTPYGVVVSDPADGSTRTIPVAMLYSRWRWTQSIVVG